jgi:glycosyltransferase involved in cell wall biosynthesis
MKNKLPLSVIILTHRNDQRFIKAISSAQMADEVLILDYQSQNNWPTLAKKYQFNLVKRTGVIENFASERNLALAKAKHDWVLFLDSDEEIVETSWPEIAQALNNPAIDGFFVNRVDIFYGQALKFGETGSSKFLRLIRKDKAKYLRPVHEKAVVAGNTEDSQIFLHHYSHTNINEFITDITHYATLEAEYQNDDLLSPLALGLKTIAYSKAKFFNNYILKLGFLDGWRGLVYASIMSLHSLMVRVFSYENR